MTSINSYSTTASENVTANTGINWDEGMPPATVNNSARQNMADMRALANDLPWFQYGVGSKTVAAVYSSGTAFTFSSSTDATAYWHAGRRVRAAGASTGTIYGQVSSSAFATNVTTVNVIWDSGSLSNESLTVSAGTPVTGMPVAFPTGTWTPTDASGAGLSLTVSRAAYIRVGTDYFCDLTLSFPSTADATAVKISLPATAANVSGVGGAFAVQAIGYANPLYGNLNVNAANFGLITPAGVAITNANMSSSQLRAQFRLPTV